MTSHWLNRERLKLYPCAMLLILGFIGAYWMAGSHHGIGRDGNPLGYDFVGPWAAARLAAQGEAAAAYDPSTLDRMEGSAVAGAHPHTPLGLPPQYMLLMLPLSLLPYFPAYLLFAAGSLAAYVRVLTKTLRSPGVLLPVLAFPAVFLNLLGGQNGLLTAALLGAALLLLRRRPLVAGALIGLLTIKPHLGLLLPLALLCGRHWRALLAAVLVAALLLGLSVLVLGEDALHAFLSRLTALADQLAATRVLMEKIPTPFIFARLLGLPAAAAYGLAGGVALLAAAAVAWVWLRCRHFELQAATLAAASMLVSPYLFDYDLAWLALALAWFTLHALQHGWLPWEREVLVAAWLLPILMQPLYWLLHVQLAMLVLLALLLMILRRVRWERSPGAVGSAQSMAL